MLDPAAVSKLRIQIDVEALVCKFLHLMRHDIQPRNGVSPRLCSPSCTDDLDVDGSQEVDHVSSPQGVVFLGLTISGR